MHNVPAENISFLILLGLGYDTQAVWPLRSRGYSLYSEEEEEEDTTCATKQMYVPTGRILRLFNRCLRLQLQADAQSLS